MSKSIKLAMSIILFGVFIAGFFLFFLGSSSAQDEVIVNMTASIVKKSPEGKFIGGWDPNKIEVKEGQKVVINITTSDIEHEFILPDYKIFAKIEPEHTATVSFVSDKPGTFTYSCRCQSVHCGPYHKQMVGQLIVQPKI